MFNVQQEISLVEFKAWGGAVSRLEKIIEYDMVDEATDYIVAVLGDTFTETELNDFLWFEMDTLFEEIEDEEY